MEELPLSNIYLQIGSLLYVLLIISNYIRKINTLTLENIIYSCLLIAVGLDLVVNIESILLPLYTSNNTLIVFFNKIELLTCASWILLSSYYTFIITSPRSQGYVSYKENKELPYFKKIGYIFIAVFAIASLLMLIFSLEYSQKIDLIDDNFMKFTGKMNVLAFIIWIINTIYLIIVNLKAQKKKSIPSKKRRIIISSILYIIAIALMFILKVNNYKSVQMQRIGTSIILLQLLFIANIIVSNLSIISNAERIKLEKYSPLIIITPALSLSFMFETFIPNTVTTAIVGAFMVIYMYFSIENPDAKLIEELNENRIEADQANLEKTRFLSNMSHEIRTPLNAIIGFSQALKEENISKEANDEVDDIIMSSNNLLDIVNGILDISKIEANKLEIEEKEYDSAQMFKEIVALAKARLASRPIDFRINIDNDIPPVLFGDYLRVKQVIINLLTNSIKYTKEGFIDFSVKGSTHDDKELLDIIVRDSGIGIKEEDLGKLFTKFQRLDLEKNAATEGTGLGLAITKSLIEIMGGTVNVKSEYGKGSEFNIKLDQGIVHKDVSEIKKVNEVTTTVEISPDKKVIVVDDNKVNLKVASRLLKDYNIDPILVESGEDCINRIKNGEVYDLILMDDMMPKMTGTEAMKLLKEIPGFTTPVVVLTANAISGMREKYLQVGFDEYLAKPINKDQLASVINYFLNTTTEHTTLEFSGRNQFTATTSSTSEETPQEEKNTEIELPKEEVKKEEIELPKTEETKQDELDLPKEVEEQKEEPKQEEIVEEAKIEEPVEEKVEEPQPEETPKVETPTEQPTEEPKEEPTKEESTETVEETTSEEPKEEATSEEEVADKHTKEYLESQGVDVDHGLELLGDMETYEMILDEFLNNIDERLNKLTTTLEQKDMPNFAIEVHALKSDAKYLGCMTLADIAYKYEMASKENNIGEVEAGFAGLKEETEKVVKIIKNYLGK